MDKKIKSPPKMDEAEIVKKIAPPEKKEETKISQPTDESGFVSKVKEWTPLYQYFGITQPSPRHDQALSLIWNWAKEQSEFKDLDSIKWTITRKMNQLGSPPLGTPSYFKLENYIIVYNRFKEYEKRLKELEKES
jgi:hypothetical protein